MPLKLMTSPVTASRMAVSLLSVLPGRAARQLPDQSTTLWVESSSTSGSRLRGALPTCDIERAGRPKEKAARRRLSILIVVNQAAIKAGFDFGRWAALADNDF
jgi:hypothetical protein